MKKLFTFAFALLATLAANAQLDPSTWEAGQDVTAILGLGDVDGTFSGERAENTNGDYSPSTMGNYWQGSMPTEWNYLDALETGALAFYFDGKAQGPLTDIYQVVYFPAGYYTLKIQALYREGTPVDNFNNHFNGVIKKNAWIYAAVLAGETAESEVTREFTQYVRSLATSEQTERLYFDSDGSWKNDASGVYHQGEEDEVTYWCPCCLPGTITYFANGRYWNQMTIALTEGAYVRLGLKKTANIAQDWFAFSNLSITYNGQITPEVEKELAYEDFQAKILNLEEVRDKAGSIGFGALYSIIDDKMMELDDAVSSESTLEEILAGETAVDEAIDGFNSSIQFALQLNDLLSMSADMLESTDFTGKAAFQAAYDDAYAKAHTEDPADINYDAATYDTIYTQLAQDRANYLLTSPQDENGAWDFTSLIKNPWFVNPEYTPVKLDDGTWCIQQDGSTDLWRHYTVAQGATQVPSGNIYNNGRANVTSKVTLSADETVTNAWFKVVNYTQGWSNGLNLMYQGALIGVSDGWNTGLEGTLEIRQQLVGLPNGYYNLKGLMRGNGTNATITWDADHLPPYHNIFAQNSDEIVVKSPVGSTDSYYSPQYGWYEWNANVWQEHKTSIIQVADGKLLIGGQSSMVMNVTGFRLGFYGENPDFNGMIQEELDEIAPKLEALLFKGDKAAVQALVDQIQLPLASAGDYETALALTREAKDYLQKAQNATNSFNAADTYNTLAVAYEEGSAQADILLPAQEYIAAFVDADETVYTDAAGATEICNAYQSYIAVYDKAEALNYGELNDILAEQAAVLKAGYSDAETLAAYQARLEQVIPLATIVMLGGGDATAENPVDVSSLLKNPTFDNGAGEWSGTGASTNEFARGNAEIWNQNTFDFYQILKSMPAGKYQLKVRALYRDSRNVTDDYVVAGEEGNETFANKCYYTWWTLANADAAQWIDNFAVAYMSTGEGETLVEATDYIKSVCDGKFTEPSFTGYFSLPDAGYTVGNNGAFLFYEELNETDLETIETDPETGEILYDYAIDYTKAQDYPFDEKVFDGENTYFYPSSMAGAAKRFAMSPEAYNCTVDFELTETGDLRLGLRKSAGFEGDWVIFDDFQLFFLGGDLPSGINEVETANAKANNSAIYNIAGQKVANAVKGLYIVNGKKVYVK